MLTQAGFAAVPENKPANQTNESGWYIAISLALVLFLTAVHAQNDSESVSSTIESEQASGSTETVKPVIVWPQKELALRVKELGLDSRVSINKTSQKPSFSIRTDLLFSEGAGEVSRAGKQALRQIFEGLTVQGSFTLELKQRPNTEVEYTHGIQMASLIQHRERSLKEFLHSLGLEANIQP